MKNHSRLAQVFRSSPPLPWVLACAIAPLLYAYGSNRPSLGQDWLLYFTVFVLTFFPGWLFVRFITMRGAALWYEYVINLHRLGVDRWEFLPEPPKESEYYGRWRQARQGLDPNVLSGENLYLQKFNAYYGRSFRESVEDKPRSDTLFPVVLYTAVTSVGWTATLAWGAVPLQQMTGYVGALSMAFFGAYLFNLQMLVRRFFQNDLKSSAYASAFTRIVSVLLIVTVLIQLPALQGPELPAVAFVIGFFPVMGLQFLQRVAQALLRTTVRSLQTEYPLSELDGLNLWYESRLLEEAIEDQEELITSNIVDVLLHTRVPVARLVDWLDQAHLYLHLPPQRRRGRRRLSKVLRQKTASVISDQAEGPGTRVPSSLRARLRNAGIRNATELLIAFDAYRPLADPADTLQGGNLDLGHPSEQAQKLARHIGGDQAESLLNLVRVISSVTSLTPILNWRHWGAGRLYDLEAGSAHDDDSPQGRHATIQSAFAVHLAVLVKDFATGSLRAEAGEEVEILGPGALVRDGRELVRPTLVVTSRAVTEVLWDEVPLRRTYLILDVVDRDDVGARLERYAQNQVPHVWIFDLRTWTLVMYRLQSSKYERHGRLLGSYDIWPGAPRVGPPCPTASAPTAT